MFLTATGNYKDFVSNKNAVVLLFKPPSESCLRIHTEFKTQL